MRNKYKVRLTPNQRKQLLNIIQNGEGKAKKMTHARVLLMVDCSKEGPSLKAKK